MGIAGSNCDAQFLQEYLGIRAEWVDMSEVQRRYQLDIYDKEEFEQAMPGRARTARRALIKTPIRMTVSARNMSGISS